MASASAPKLYGEENPVQEAQASSSAPPVPADTQIGDGATFVSLGPQNFNRGSSNFSSLPEATVVQAQVVQVERRFVKDQQVIRRKRGLLMSLAIHASVFILVNAIVWAAWGVKRSHAQKQPPSLRGGRRLPGDRGSPQWPPAEEHGPPADVHPQMKGRGGLPDGEPDPSPAPFTVPGWPNQVIPDTRDSWSAPFPAWVTFGTATLLAFHLVNTLPLILTRRPDHDHCPFGWNYWVVANLLTVVVVQWAVFALSGGFANHMHPWPVYFTVVAAATCVITTTIACVGCSCKGKEPIVQAY